MRFAFVAFAVVCSFRLVAAQTASTDPSVGAPKLAVTKAAPPPTSVNVLNFPETQAVTGSVSVENLPLDTDGALRVTSAPAREPVLIELVPAGVTVESMTTYLSPIVDVAGYSKVGFQSSGNWNAARPTWRWAGAPSDDFASVANFGEAHSANGDCGSPQNGERYICLVSGVQLRFQLWNNTNVPAQVGPIRVYLIP